MKKEVPIRKNEGAKELPRNVSRRFTKDFKEGAVRRVEEGTPLKQVARADNIDPAVVRAWRAELRDLGPRAFLQSGRRRFTKEFKETAIARVEEGIPLKEVARSCRVCPSQLRKWRTAWRTLGSRAFSDSEHKKRAEPKTRTVIFRLTEDEHNRLKAIAKKAGVRSLSDFARSRLLEEAARPSVGSLERKNH